jgi:hypothetical protein
MTQEEFLLATHWGSCLPTPGLAYIPESVRGGESRITVPDPWRIIDESEHAEHDGSILVEHPDGYTAELWRRSEDIAEKSPLDLSPEQLGAGMWDIDYVDPDGTRRDGSGSFHENPQEAFDQLVPHITEVRARRRDIAAQKEERKRVDWPERIGRYRCLPDRVSETSVTYRTRYLHRKTVWGPVEREDTLKIRFYRDTRRYYVDGESFARKSTAIEAAKEILNERTKKFDQREQTVIERNDIADHRLPERVKSNG